MKKTKVEKWIVLPDMHVPEEDKETMRAVESYMGYKDFKKIDGYINLGDFMSLDCISEHNIKKLRKIETKRVQKDYDEGNKVLDRHQALLGNIKYYLLEGNHEYRMERYIDANPALEGSIEVPLKLRLEERNIKWIKSWSKGELLKRGNATFAHGRYITKYHANKMVEYYGTPIFYGHTHDIMEMPKVLHGADKTIVGHSLGCLCLYDQEYLRGGPTNWQHSFTIFYFFPNGFFNYYPVKIFNHKFVSPEGRVFDGNKKRP